MSRRRKHRAEKGASIFCESDALTKLALSLALVSSPAWAAPAAAQAVSALKGHDTHAPVDVTADRIEVQDKANRAIFSGNVKIVQNEMTLTAARVTVIYSNAGGDSPQVQRMDASGNVYVVDPSETARGDFGVYDTQRRLITMLGNVTLTRGQNVVHGARLVMDLDSGRSTLDGSAVGGTSASGGRVTGRFTVPKKTTATPAPAAAPNKPTP
jgi:lipopolysaccharide export system protein LptA